MGRGKITSQAEGEKRNAASAAQQSLKEGSAEITSSVASAAKRLNMGREKITSRAELEKRNAAAAAKQSS